MVRLHIFTIFTTNLFMVVNDASECLLMDFHCMIVSMYDFGMISYLDPHMGICIYVFGNKVESSVARNLIIAIETGYFSSHHSEIAFICISMQFPNCKLKSVLGLKSLLSCESSDISGKIEIVEMDVIVWRINSDLEQDLKL